jgi:glyoxylase-like metal-dependent hydrolase (beta-lactamase superfamily II)
MTVYLRSLERLLSLDLAALAPGHGHVIGKPHDEVRRLIAHRLKREQKVVGAFSKKNPATLDELLPFVYDDVPQRVHLVARRSLHAHLLKLRDEGKAVEAGETWKLR